MKDIKWFKRSEEWIKENPKKPTMFKGFTHPDGSVIEITKEKKEIFQLLPESKRKFSWDKPKKPAVDPGVYLIICEVEKYVYVGQSSNMLVRLRNHKMNIESPLQNNNAYTLMKAHNKLHGIESFQFVPFKSFPEHKEDQMLKEEAKVITEMWEQGYSLYNRSVPPDVYFSSIHCPKEFKEVVIKIVSSLKDSNLSVNQLTEFMQSIPL